MGGDGGVSLAFHTHSRIRHSRTSSKQSYCHEFVLKKFPMARLRELLIIKPINAMSWHCPPPLYCLSTQAPPPPTKDKLYQECQSVKLWRDNGMIDISLNYTTLFIELYDVMPFYHSRIQRRVCNYRNLRLCITVTLTSLTSWSRFVLQMLIVSHLVKNLPLFHWNRKFITMFTRICHWSLYITR
jgi:hypothetical protein